MLESDREIDRLGETESDREGQRDRETSRVSIGLNFVKLPCLSGRMTKLSPMETQGKLPSLLSYRDLDVKLPGRKGPRKLSAQPR